MKLHILFEQPEESHPGQYAPVALAVLDEYTVANFDSLEAAKESELTYLSRTEKRDPTEVVGAWIEVDIGSTEQQIRDAILQPTLRLVGAVSIPTAPHPKHPSYESITVTKGRPGGPRRIADDEITE